MAQGTQGAKKGDWRQRGVLGPVALLVGVTFLVGLYGRGLNTGLPLYYDTLGYSAVLGGSFVSVYTLASMAMRLVGGQLTDRFDHLRVLLAALACLLAGAVVPALWHAVPVVLACRVIQGAGFALCANVVSVEIMDLAGHAKLGVGVSVNGVGSSLATMLGAAVATGLLGSVGYVGFFVAYAGLVVLAAALVLALGRMGRVKELRAARRKRLEQERGAQKPADAAREADAVARSFWLPATLPYLAVAFARRLVKGACVAFMLVFAHFLGWKTGAWFFVIAGASELAGRMAFATRFDAMARGWLLPMVALNLLGFGALALWHTQPAFFFAAFCYGLSIGTASPFLKTLTAKSVAKEHWGTANGELYFTGDLGIVCGSFVAGLAIDALGKEAVPAVVLVLALAASLITAVVLALGRRAH